VQLGTNESIALGVKEVTTSQNDESTPKKTWKLVSLARVWLGTNENTGLGNEKKPPLPT
jgi:hypothetical protein